MLYPRNPHRNKPQGRFRLASCMSRLLRKRTSETMSAAACSTLQTTHTWIINKNNRRTENNRKKQQPTNHYNFHLLTTNLITTKLTNQNQDQRHKYHRLTTTLHSVDSENDYRSGSRNVSHQQLTVFLKTTSPGRSRQTHYYYYYYYYYIGRNYTQQLKLKNSGWSQDNQTWHTNGWLQQKLSNLDFLLAHWALAEEQSSILSVRFDCLVVRQNIGSV